MRDRYRLGGLANDELLAALAALVRRENDAMSDLLAHLAELDERRLFLDLGYPSLFAYCTGALGFCKSSAGRRIAVARVCRKYPEVFARVARGELQLSVLSLLGPHLNPENAAGLFEACLRKSCDQVEELLAARFPRADVRDSIRRLPPRTEASPGGGSVSGAAPSAEAAAPQSSPLALPPALPAQRKLEPLSPDRFGVHFTADAEFRELLEDVRALASHREPEGNLLRLMKRGLEAYRRELQKQRFGIGGSRAYGVKLAEQARVTSPLRRRARFTYGTAAGARFVRRAVGNAARGASFSSTTFTLGRRVALQR